MSNAKIKTVPRPVDVRDFLALIEDKRQRSDSEVLIGIMHKVSGKSPVMWGSAIIGFDSYHYKYESGREGDMPRIAFSPRKGKLTLYVMDDASNYPELRERLGKHKVSKACIYITKLSDVNMDVLEQLITLSYKDSFKIEAHE